MSAVGWELLGDLGAEDRDRVVESLHRRRFKAGEVVFHEGDRADTVHFVAEGRLIVRRSTEDGDRVAFTVLGPGAAFGEMAMLSPDRRRTSTVQALDAAATLTLTYADFDRLCAAHPGITRLLVRLLAQRVTRLSGHLVEALHVPADRRVARRLLDLCLLYAGGPGTVADVALPVTQTDVADLAGASRPTANRVLRRLEAAEALSLKRGRILVHDIEAVRRAAQIGLPASLSER